MSAVLNSAPFQCCPGVCGAPGAGSRMTGKNTVCVLASGRKDRLNYKECHGAICISEGD